MKAQEAIEALKLINLKRVHPFYAWEEMKDVRDIAISALEKQIPKKPVNTRREIVCPTCRTLVGSSPYCRYCGQMLDHSAKESEDTE